MKEIPLSNCNLVVQVDDEDYEKVSQYRWGLRRERWERDGYYKIDNTTIRKITIPIAILGEPPLGMEWDHKDHNPLNNQRSNLRLANAHQQVRNRRKRRAPSTSKYKGVYSIKRRKKWVACILIDGKNTILGYFANEEDAAKAADGAARKYHGVFASLNFPQLGEQCCLAQPTEEVVFSPQIVKTSRFVGVFWHKRDKKWNAQIAHNKKKRYLGAFRREEDAARAVDDAVKSMGLDRPLNFPEEVSRYSVQEQPHER